MQSHLKDSKNFPLIPTLFGVAAVFIFVLIKIYYTQVEPKINQNPNPNNIKEISSESSETANYKSPYTASNVEKWKLYDDPVLSIKFKYPNLFSVVKPSDGKTLISNLFPVQLASVEDQAKFNNVEFTVERKVGKFDQLSKTYRVINSRQITLGTNSYYSGSVQNGDINTDFYLLSIDEDNWLLFTHNTYDDSKIDVKYTTDPKYISKAKQSQITKQILSTVEFKKVSNISAACGGVSNIKCPFGYECKLKNNYPNEGGTCIKK